MQQLLFDPLRQDLAKLIQTALKDAFEYDEDALTLANNLTVPPNTQLGDLCIGCFPYAKALRKSPKDIAESVGQALKTSSFVESFNLMGPYINFKLNTSQIAKSYGEDILKGDYFKTQLSKQAPKCMVEFSQPNTHKELHVGHMRNLCLGDAIIKLLRYTNHEVISCTFPGDVGTHVAKCLWYMKHHNTDAIPTERKGAWLGTLYTKGNNLLEEQKGTEQEDRNREELTEILRQLHAGSGDYYDLWRETREWSIGLMQDVYQWADVSFDEWYWESDVDADSVKLVQEYFDSGLFVKDQGAIGIDLSDDKLGFCLLLKSDGTGLYATKDVELARKKFSDYKVEKNIYVVDNRQAHHFKQVFKVLEKMGFEHAKDCYHLQYDMVELTDGAMSSRKGNIVPLQALIEQMVQMIEEKYLNKYRGDWSEEEIDSTANKVARGAIKYGMTKVDHNKKIVFDMQEWLKLDGDSGPYIQYVYARINSLLEKVGRADIDDVDFTQYTHQIEKDIWFKISQFNSIVYKAALEYKTSSLTAYLYDLAKSFNSFYAECPVGNAESVELKNARLMLCQNLAIVLENGLALLGIEAPKRM
jgi:arginyl-tRNA synthetase